MNYTLAAIKSPFKLSDESKRTFRKEVIYEGAFYDPAKGKSFAVTMPMLENWVTQFELMQAVGVKVPMPIHHTNDPESNRGFVVGAEIALNNEGVRSLYLDVQFAKPEFEFLASISDVSIFSAEKFTDGKGNVYPGAILHLALTTSPVIPKLEGFEAIAASLTQPTVRKADTMELKELLDKANMTAEEGKEAEVILAALLELGKLKAEIKAAADKPEDVVKKEDEDENKIAEEEKAKMLSLVSPSLVGVLRKNREHEIKELICASKISPKVGKDLTAKYCQSEGLALSLVSGNEKFDDFDELVAILKQNEVAPLNEKTGHQSISLSSDDNCMIKAAKSRV